METHNLYSEWYAKNRDRLLPIRRKYNKQYSQRPEVIERAKIKNAKPAEKARRIAYKLTEEGKTAEKRYREKHKENIKNISHIHWLKRYGLTPQAVGELLTSQHNCCRICDKDISTKFHIDHDHKTNKVRGLLCVSCNMGLGLFKDDEILLRKAISYLV